MASRTNSFHHCHGAILAAPVGGTERACLLASPPVAHRNRIVQHHPGSRLLAGAIHLPARDGGVLQREVLRTDDRDEGSCYARIFDRVVKRIAGPPPPTASHRGPAPSVPEDTDFQASFAQAKRDSAYVKRTIHEQRRFFDWDGRSDHPWAQVIRGGPEERHR